MLCLSGWAAWGMTPRIWASYLPYNLSTKYICGGREGFTLERFNLREWCESQRRRTGDWILLSPTESDCSRLWKWTRPARVWALRGRQCYSYRAYRFCSLIYCVVLSLFSNFSHPFFSSVDGDNKKIRKMEWIYTNKVSTSVIT